MKLCIVTAASIQITKDGVFTDAKNVNAIKRYLPYFDKIHVIGRKPYKKNIYNHVEFQHEDRITFETINYNPKVKGILSTMNNLSAAVENGAKDCDLILSWALPESLTIIKSAKKIDKKICIYVGGCQFNSLFYMNSLIRKIIAFPVLFNIRSAIKNADYVHYVTQSALQSRYPTPGKTVAASYVNLNLANCDSILDKRLSEKKPVKTIGIIGYLNPIKGIDTAIKAISQTKGNFILRILGGGDPQKYKDLAESLGIADRVIFEGTLPPGEPVQQWLGNIDLYLQPSITEGLPRATLEAMSMGCPVISTSAMGLREIVKPEWRHKRGDFKSLAKLIDAVSNSDEMRRDLIKHSIKTAKEYDRNKLDERINTFFQQIKNDIKANKSGDING